MNLGKLAFIMSLINKGNGGENVNLSDYYTKLQTDARIAERIAEIVANAPEDFDTLKEISDWIENHEDSAAAMNSAIAQKADKSTTYTKTEVNTALDNKVDKVAGKQLSTNDFTDAYKTKVDDLENYDDTEIKAKIAKTAEQSALNSSTLGYQRKNLLKVMSSFAGTKSGVTVTQQSDGKLVVSGTNTAAYTNYIFNITSDGYTISNGKALFIKGAETINNCRYMVGITTATGTNDWLDIPHQGLVISGDTTIRTIYVQQNTIGKEMHAEIYPLVQLAEIQDTTYEPYKPSVEERIDDIIDQIFGLGETIPSGADLNDYTQPGVYYVQNSSISATLLNCPVNGTGFRFEVCYTSFNNRFMQRLYANAMIPTIFIRTYGINGFGSWYKFPGEAVTT